MPESIPNVIDPPLGPDGRFILGWYRYFQGLGTTPGARGLPGPQGPTGSPGPAGPPGTSDADVLSVLGLSDLDGSSAVSSVALVAPVEFTVTGSPITDTGTITLTKANETANTVWAGPTSGGAAAPTFRALVGADLGGMSAITNSLTSNVALNNIANFFDGPSVAQGTSGTWFASGTVTVGDSASAATFDGRLWDGTTVVATVQTASVGAGQQTSISLSGFFTSPAGNIRISVKDQTAATGNIFASGAGTANTASTITAIRIG